MKGVDFYQFMTIILLSLIAGPFIIDQNFDKYSDVITYLSIMIGFKITSLSILYNSSLRRTLYDRKIKPYKTELHRLKDFFKHSLIFEVISVFIIFIFPENIFHFIFYNYSIVVGRRLTVLPILTGTMFCFYKIFDELLKIFSHPTN